MKKLFSALFLCTVLLCGCSGSGEDGISETAAPPASSADVTTETSAKEETVTTTTAVTTAATTTEETSITEKAVDTSGVDFIKEALKSNWGGGENYGGEWKGNHSDYSSVYFADMNADGVDELFVSCHYKAGITGCVSVYDVFDGVKLICEMEARTPISAGSFYTDLTGITHYIIRSDYWNSSDIFHTAYFDLTYNENGVSLTVPFVALPDTWYDGGEFKSEYSVYTDSSYDISDVYQYKSYGFKSSEDNYLGNYSIHDISYDDNGETDSGEIKDIIQKSVFDGLTYICDAEPFILESKYADFDEFWDNAAPVIAEKYGDVQ